MLHITIVLSAVSPMVLEHRTVVAIRFWARTMFQLVFAFAVAALVYFALLLALVETYPIDLPLRTIVYAGGFSLATLLSEIAGTVASPARLLRFVRACCLGFLRTVSGDLAWRIRFT